MQRVESAVGERREGMRGRGRKPRLNSSIWTTLDNVTSHASLSFD